MIQWLVMIQGLVVTWVSDDTGISDVTWVSDDTGISDDRVVSDDTGISDVKWVTVTHARETLSRVTRYSIYKADNRTLT